MTTTLVGRFVLSFAVLAASTISLTSGCREPTGGGPAAPAADIDDQTPCERAFGTACGVACSDVSPCAAGLHCEGGSCTAECIDDTDCGAGECSADGRCVAESGVEPSNIKVDPVETDPNDPNADEPPQCVEGQVEFAAVMPQVWLLLDRSGSMTSLLGTLSRWEALGAVVVGDPVDAADRGVVGDFEDRVAFGAVFYTSGAGPSGCILDLESIALASNNYAAIRQRYNKLAPSGGTPTADSIAATVAVASTSDLTGGPKILVLATDGVPGDCALREETATAEVEKEVAKAFGKGIETFAVSIASETDASHMQRVANLGVGLPADAVPAAPYYTAESRDELKVAFSTILEDVPRSCVFSLNGEVEEENADQGTVTLGGETLTFGDENGWRLKQADQVELVGAACDQIQAGAEDLDITFPCSVFKPVIK